MPIEEKQADSLDDFWNILSPIGDFIGNMHSPIFRGQGDANWSLAPSVLRKEIISKYQNENGTSIYTQIDHIVFFEYFLLHDFLDYCDEMGLLIPNDSVEFRQCMEFREFTNRYGINGAGWPSKEYLSFLALAQHHGIPTRLLDWTRSSFVAAYFAATQVLRFDKIPKMLSVWVIDNANTLNGLENELQHVVLPGSTSNNLAAQRGSFLVHRQINGINRNSSFSSEDLKDSVNIILKECKSCIAYNVTLPASRAGDLFFRCNKFGISAATMFPGFDGAAKAALEFKMAKKFARIL